MSPRALRWRPPSRGEVLEFARGADLLINASGVLKDERILAAIPTRLYLDLDPAFTQLWQAFEGVDSDPRAGVR